MDWIRRSIKQKQKYLSDSREATINSIMEKTKFYNFLNYEIQNGEVNTEPSLTVPEMTLGLKDLLARYTRGQSVATLTPVYLGDDEEFAEYDGLDRLEKMQLARDNKEYIANIQKSKQHTVRREEIVSDAPQQIPQSDAQSVATSGSALGVSPEKST